MSKKVKMGVCVAVASSGRPVQIEWALAIATLTYPVGMNHAWLVSKADPDNPQVTRDVQRETLTERALALGTEFLMCIDDDTVPPAHAIQSLWYVLSQNPKAAVAAGIYCTKSENPEPIVYREIGAGAAYDWTLGDVFPVKGLGLGCMMIRLSALKNIPKPWFHDTVSGAPRKEIIGGLEVDIVSDSGTDDLYFCQKATDAGYEIIAHGGVLPVHMDEVGKQYVIPEDSYPVVSYKQKRAEYEAEQKLSEVEIKS